MYLMGGDKTISVVGGDKWVLAAECAYDRTKKRKEKKKRIMMYVVRFCLVLHKNKPRSVLVSAGYHNVSGPCLARILTN